MKKDKLHNIKSTGFKTPDNYFSSFEDKLLGHLSENKLIDGVESTGFDIPNNYFKSIEDNVLEKLNIEDKQIITLKRRKALYYLAGIAASLILLFALFYNNEVSDDSLSVEMVESYLNDRDLSSYEIAQLLSDADLLNDEFNIAPTNFDEVNLEDYLLDNADIETIIEN